MTGALRPTLSALALVLALSGCASAAGDTESGAGTDSTTSTTGAGALVSSGAAAAPTTEASTETTVPEPEPTTTTTSLPPPDEQDDRLAELDADPVFTPILDELVAFAGPPIRLPADLGLDDDSDLVPTLWSADADHYVVFLGVGPNCNGGDVCRVATFTAERHAVAEQQGVAVELPGGSSGDFLDATCGANCGDGTLRWTEDDVTYSVGRKLANAAAMLRWAWSAIDPEGEPPQPPEACGPGAAADAGRVARISRVGSTHWLVLCSEDGLQAELVEDDGVVRWFDFDGDGARDVVLTYADGSSRLFDVNSIAPLAVVDNESFARLVVGDLRCGWSPDGTPVLYDASTDERLDLINPTLATRVAEPPPTNDVCA